MFYGGDTIYSHGQNFPIARHFEAPNGERVVLYNEESFSVSTSRHQAIVRAAITGDVPVVSVPHLRWGIGGTLHHEDVMATIVHLAELWTAARGRKPVHEAAMAERVEQANRIRELWQLDVPVVTMPMDIAAYPREYREERRRRAEEAHRIAEAKAMESLAAWVRGEIDHPPATRNPHVRVVGSTVETSAGFQVPLKRALALFKLAGRIRKCGSEWVPERLRLIGGHRIDGITADGTIKVGCHVLPYEVQLKAAKLAGLA